MLECHLDNALKCINKGSQYWQGTESLGKGMKLRQTAYPRFKITNYPSAPLTFRNSSLASAQAPRLRACSSRYDPRDVTSFRSTRCLSAVGMIHSFDALILTKVLKGLTLRRFGECFEYSDAMSFTALSVIMHMKSCIAKAAKSVFKAWG